MRRLLNDSAGRIYQRVGKEEKLKEEPQDLDAIWPQRLNSAEGPEPPPIFPGVRGRAATPERAVLRAVWHPLQNLPVQPHTAGSSNGMAILRCSQLSQYVFCLETFSMFFEFYIVSPPLITYLN